MDERDGERAWSQLSERLERGITRHLFIAVRVGASALAVGNITLALIVTLWLGTETDWSALQSHYDARALLEWESMTDEFYGHLLGPNPDGSLQGFVRFGERTAQHVS